MSTDVSASLGHLGETSTVRRRPATDHDVEFLRELYAHTRADELSELNWSPEQRRSFCDFQFDMHEANLRMSRQLVDDEIIESGARPVGRMITSRAGSPWRIVDISLMPQYRGVGIGTALLTSFIDEARAAGAGVSLHVLNDSPARRLYERLGFTVVADAEPRSEMTRPVTLNRAHPVTASVAR